MAPSLSTIERGNPPPRRRSCTACARAKRRCDLARPSCLRCSQRSLPCRYHCASTERLAQHAIQGTVDPSHSREPSQPGRRPLAPKTQVHELFGPWNGEQEDLARDNETDHLLDLLGPTLEDPFAEYSLAINVLDDSTLAPSILDLIPRASMLIFSSRTQPTPSEWLKSIIARNLQFSIDEIARAPQRMVQENNTPWCHHHLYRDIMPRCIQDAQACCALYIAKNSINADVVHRTIEGRLNDLISTPLQPTATPLDILARTHALLLYYIMRLFDSDHSNLSDLQPHLEEVALALRNHLSTGLPQPTELPLYPLAPTHDFWTSWVFAESARRTFIIAAVVVQIYWRLRGVMPTVCDHKLYRCEWTFGGHLWKAADAVDFAVAWSQGNHDLVTNAELVHVLVDAKPDDVDMFGRVILTTMLGIEEVKGWFVSKGSIL